MSGKSRYPSAHAAILTLVAAACASPGTPASPPPSEAPHASTVRAIRPKLDSIETRIGFVSAQLSARIDTLRALLNAVPGRSLPPDTATLTASAAIRSEAVDGSTIAGIVADAETGRPIPGAVVSVEGTGLGALSDTSGHFQIWRVPPGTYQLEVTRIGYESVTIEAPGGSHGGVVVRFVLYPHVQVSCGGVFVTRIVAVTVRDALTGRAPSTATALRVSNGRNRWWALGHAEPGAGELRLGVQPGGGPLEVEVAAEGYATWYASVVKSPSDSPDPCGRDMSRRFNVWLLPTEDQSWRNESR